MVYNLHSFKLMLQRSHPDQSYSVRKLLSKFSQNSQGNICVGTSFLRKIINKEAPSHVLSCELCEIFRDVSAGHLQTTTSEYSLFHDFSEKKTLLMQIKRKYVYILKLNLYFKNHSDVYFFKTILHKTLLILAFRVFITQIKNRFHYV